MIDFITQDWANVLLVLAGAAFVVFFMIGMLFPIFGGATASDAETPGIAAHVGAMVSSVFLLLYGLVWIARGILWIVRAIVCPC
jgi:hypothetical protein